MVLQTANADLYVFQMNLTTTVGPLAELYSEDSDSDPHNRKGYSQ